MDFPVWKIYIKNINSFEIFRYKYFVIFYDKISFSIVIINNFIQIKNVLKEFIFIFIGN